MRHHQLPLPAQPLAVAATLGLLAGAGACDVQVHDGKLDVDVYSNEAKQEWARTYTLAEGGLVEIANLNGPIDVGPASTPTVDVRAEIIAKGLTDDMAKNILSKGRIEETASPERVKVETVVPRGVHGSYEVRYRVQLPSGLEAAVSTTNGSVTANGLSGKLKVSVSNGRVELVGMSGPIDAANVNGSLTVKLTRVAGPVRLETTNGRLELELPASSKANLWARVVNGRMSVSGFPVEEQRGNRIRNLETKLNGGGPPIDVRTTNGRMTITGVEGR